MSGLIVLVYGDGRPVERDDAARMLAALEHRGPDGGSLWVEGPVALGHRMLRTTPESFHEQLPLAVRSCALVITADARIDNRDELFALLDLQDRPAHTIADSELILAAYMRWGERCPERLLGDFAFAIWDGRRRALFCARDHFGVKPLYYHAGEGLFACASEIKALLCLAEVPRRLNELRVADHLAGLVEDPESTFYRDILRLPAAHALCFSPAGVRRWGYWALDEDRELSLGSDGEYIEGFRAHFNEAVGCRVRGAPSIGTLLSGGLDSSAIACTARNQLAAAGQRVHTFSAIFPNLPEVDRRWLDERCFQEAVLATGGFEAHAVEVDRFSPLVDIDELIQQQDEAFLGPNLYIHWALYNAAQQHGIRVLLDGIDGDTTVSYGYDQLAELARTGRWWQLAREAGHLARRRQVGRLGIIWRAGFQPLLPNVMVQPHRILHRLVRPEALIDRSVIHPAFARRVGLAERIRAHERRAQARTPRARHIHALGSALMPYGLELADKLAAARGVEPRYPFFDRRLVEYCVALPLSQKFGQGWDRYIFRRAMEGLVPREVQWRVVKADLSHSFKRRLREVDRPRIEALLATARPVLSPYVDLSALRNVYRRYVDHPGETNGEALEVYSVANLALWLQAARPTVYSNPK